MSFPALAHRTLPLREALHWFFSEYSICSGPIPGTRPDSGLAPSQAQHQFSLVLLGWQCTSVCVEAEASCWLSHCSWTRPAGMTLCWLSLLESYAELGPGGSHWHRWTGCWHCLSGDRKTGAGHWSGWTTPCSRELSDCCSSIDCCRYWKRSVCCSLRRISRCEMLWQKKNI